MVGSVGPLRRPAGLRADRGAGRARPAPGGLAGFAGARRAAREAAARWALRARAGRPAQRRRHPPGPGPRDRRRRPLRHRGGPPGLRRGQRRRRRARPRWSSWPAPWRRSCPRATARSASCSSTARRSRRAAPTSQFQECALRGSKAYVEAHAPEVGEMILLDYIANKGLHDPAGAELGPGAMGAASWTRPSGSALAMSSPRSRRPPASSTTTSRSSWRGSRRST